MLDHFYDALKNRTVSKAPALTTRIPSVVICNDKFIHYHDHFIDHVDYFIDQFIDIIDHFIDQFIDYIDHFIDHFIEHVDHFID